MSATNVQAELKALLATLPLHAEEGGLREVVEEAAIEAAMRKRRLNAATVSAVVKMMRRLFEALEVLDDSELLQGRWSFVSFPASLLARSVLETLATEGESLVDEGFWIQGGHRPKAAVEEQRSILKRLETKRAARASASPIRTVHVAWGVIRLGSRYLLRAPEDASLKESRGFVFPGGRLDTTDLPQKARTAVGLRDLYRIDSALARDALPIALSRELNEELGLLPIHFLATLNCCLTPYKAVAGDRNNLSYSQYNIALFTIQLTRDGELTVVDRVAAEPEEWAWFTVDELLAGKQVDGWRAFVPALVQHFGSGLESLLRDGIPDSSTVNFAFRSEADTIELPARAREPLLRGMAGREQTVAFIPDSREWELLMTLGWHTRGLRLHSKGNAVSVLGNGWMRTNDKELFALVRKTAKRAEAAGLPVLDVDASGHFRLSTGTANVYFHPECFEYSWQVERPKKSITLKLRNIDTSLASLEGDELNVPLAPGFARNIALTEQGREATGDIERESRDHFSRARQLGLRKFISANKKTFEIVVPAAKS